MWQYRLLILLTAHCSAATVPGRVPTLVRIHTAPSICCLWSLHFLVFQWMSTVLTLHALLVRVLVYPREDPSYSLILSSLRFPAVPPLGHLPTPCLGHLQCWLIAPYGPQCLPLHSLSRISLCYTFKLSIEGLKLYFSLVFTVSDLWQSLKTKFDYLNFKSDKVPIVSVPSFPVLLHFPFLIAKFETLSKQFFKFKCLFQIKSTEDRNFPNSKRIVAGSPFPLSKVDKLYLPL